MTPLVASPDGISHIATPSGQYEEDDLGEEPGPAAAATVLLGTGSRLPLLASPASGGDGPAVGLGRVEVPGGDGDDVVVVAQLTRLGAEAEVGDRGDGGGFVGLEAEGPFVLGLVLQLQLQVLVLEVGQPELGRHAGAADTPGRAAGELAILAVLLLVVRRMPVADHGHDEGEHHAGPVVLVRVEEDAQPLKPVHAAEDGPRLGPLLGQPHGETISV